MVGCFLLLMSLPAAVSCSGEQPPSPSSVTGVASEWPREVTVDVTMQEWLRSEGSDGLILEMVADGILDFGEYEQALLAFQSCMNQHGWPDAEGYPRLAPWGEYLVKFGGRPKVDGQSPIEGIAGASECTKRYWRGISRPWNLHHQPSEREMQDARNAVAGCLRDRGVDAPESPSADQLLRAYDSAMSDADSTGTWRECTLEAERTHYISGYGVIIVN